MAARIWPAHKVVIYNTAGSFGAGPGKNPLPGFVFVYRIYDLIQVLRQNPEQLRVCFTPVGDRAISGLEVFHDTCELLMDYKDVVFAVEEIWNFQRPQFLPTIQQQIILQWRHYRMPVQWNAQQPQLVAQTLRSVTTEAYVGKFTHKLDLKAVRDCGLPEEAMRVIPSLPHRKFVHKYPDGNWRIEEA